MSAPSAPAGDLGAPPPYPGEVDSPKVQGGMPPAGPPPGTYYPPGAAQPPPVMMPGQTTIIMHAPMMGPMPLGMQCNHCHAQVVTEITPVAGTLAWLICILLAVFGCWLGCCLIPFCMTECQDIEHRCPNCKAYLGTHRRM